MMETWKVVYSPPVRDGGRMCVAFVEAANRAEAMYAFQKQYAGQFFTIESCEKL